MKLVNSGVSDNGHDFFIAFEADYSEREKLRRWLEVNAEQHWMLLEDVGHSPLCWVVFASEVDFDIAYLRYR
jgi:hypothetical protein